MKTFKILGLFLTYPVPETVSLWPSMLEVLAQENILPKKSFKQLQAWAEANSEKDIYALQEDYVETFDRGRGHCLHLFEHVHGESRERGQAMVDLTSVYAEKGLLINEAELPDYLPMFLEYCSLCEYSEAQSLLGEVSNIIASIGAKLKQRENNYYLIFDGLLALAKAKVDKKIIEAAIAFVHAEDTSLDALDKEWEEAEAFGGDPQVSDCHSCTSVEEQTIKIVGGL